MLYIYRRGSSPGARELVNGLMEGGTPTRRWSSTHPRTPRETDRCLCWGDANPGSNAAGTSFEVLGGAPTLNKYQQALKLIQERVPTIQVSPTLPPSSPVVDLFPTSRVGWTLDRQEAAQVVAELQAWLNAPPPPQEVWLARALNHIGGADLLAPPHTPGYFSKKEPLTHEYRIHVFRGKVIRSGEKAPRRDTPVHPWIRSYDGGWYLSYDGFSSTKDMRILARKAVAALGLDFGAVDLGLKEDGSLIVLEVNRAPGLEGGTVSAYVSAIQRWLRGEE